MVGAAPFDLGSSFVVTQISGFLLLFCSLGIVFGVLGQIWEDRKIPGCPFCRKAVRF